MAQIYFSQLNKKDDKPTRLPKTDEVPVSPSEKSVRDEIQKLNENTEQIRKLREQVETQKPEQEQQEEKK